MRKLISLLLAVLTLASCGCMAVPSEDTNVSDIADYSELVNIAAEEAKEVRVSPTEYAYIRRGSAYQNKNWRELNRDLGLDTNNEEVLIFKKGGAQYEREVLFTFDLTEIDAFPYKKIWFRPSYTSVDSKVVQFCNIYKLDASAWDTETVTWANQPQQLKLLVENASVGGLGGIDMTAAVTECLKNGEKALSFIMIIQTDGAQNENKINPKTTVLAATTVGSDDNFVTDLTGDPARNKEIWDWAQNLFEEWFDRYSDLRKVQKFPAQKIVSDEDEYTKTVYSAGSGIRSSGEWNLSNVNKPYATRTYDALDDLGDYSDYDTVYEMDIYGGWMDPSMRQKVTGFFYSQKIGDRWYIIDPLGYPCYIRGLSSINVNYLNSPNQKAEALEKYGTAEKFGIATVRWVKDELGFNISGDNDTISPVESRLAIQKTIGFVGAYGSKIGVNSSNGGSTHFSENNTMPVFDPGFIEFAAEKAKEALPDKNNEWVIGYTTDNELPMDSNMLNNYLTIDPTKEVNYYSYAAAWTWLCNMTGEENPDQTDIDDELMQLFMGFVWDRYYNVVTTAFREVDPNHMMLGTRFLTSVKSKPWVLRFASLYLDAMTINWYGQWQCNADDLYAICQNVNLPIMVTEFYTKALENDGSFDDPNDPLKNTRGAGWVVRTQQDRGDFYQNFTLRLLECKNMVGWHWHQYLDDDDSPEVIYRGGKPDATGTNWKDQSNIDANKGVVNNWHEPYEELCEAMAEINLNCYRLAQHFDGKYAK